MAKVYLVDSENIGSSWSLLLDSMSKEDKMYVFYTDKSPYISYENLLQVIAHCDIPVFLKCYEGKNALDFQLVSELGFKLCQEPEAEFVIVSDDYGYDAAVRYWSERKYNVRRIGKKYCRPMLPRKREEHVIPQSEVVAVPVQGVNQNHQQVKQPEFVEKQEQIGQEQQHMARQTEEPVLVEPVSVEALVEGVSEEPVAQKELPVTEKGTVSEQIAGEQTEAEAEAAAGQISQEVLQKSQKDNQTQKRSRDRKKKHRKENAKEPDKAAGKVAEQSTTEQSVTEESMTEQTVTEESMTEQTVTEQTVTEQNVTEQNVTEQNVKEQSATEQNVTEGTLISDEHTDEDGTGMVEAKTVEAAAAETAEAQESVSEVVGAEETVPQQATETEADEQAMTDMKPEVQADSEAYKLDFQILDIVNHCGSPEPEKDARCVKELFYTLPMSNLTVVNAALKILIGNELGNDIYRELKEHQECRTEIDALYCPVMKNRFIHYVQIVLDRSELEGVTAEEIGSFLLRIPRKNLNSIRSAMMKEFGHELGAGIYTVFKAHIKVLNKI